MDVMPAEAGIQGFQLAAFWIALTLHCVSCPRPNTIPGQTRVNDKGFRLKFPDP